MRSFIVSSPGHDQLMDSSQIGWLQGAISKIIPLLISTSSYGQQFSSGGGLLPTKQLRNVSGLYIFQGTLSLVILLCGRIVVEIVISSPAQQLFFVSTSSHSPIKKA